MVLDGGDVEAILECGHLQGLSFDQLALGCGHSGLGSELALGRVWTAGTSTCGKPTSNVVAGDGVEEQQLGPGVELTVTVWLPQMEMAALERTVEISWNLGQLLLYG